MLCLLPDLNQTAREEEDDKNEQHTKDDQVIFSNIPNEELLDTNKEH